MRSCISIGKSSKYIFLAIIAFIVRIIRDFLIGLNDTENEKSIFGFVPKIKNHFLFKDLIIYLSALICGLFLYIFRKKIEMKKKGELSIRKQQKIKEKMFNKKVFLTYKIFKIRIGKHKKLTVYIISGILFFLNLLYCSLPRTHHNNCDTEEECKYRYLKDNNVFGTIEKLFGQNKIYILIVIILYIIIAIMRDYSWVKTKYLIDVKTVSLYKIFMFFGSVGLSITIIALYFSTKYSCQTLPDVIKKYDEIDHSYYYVENTSLPAIIDLSKTICPLVDHNDNSKELNFYYDSYKIMYNDYKDFKNNKIEIFAIIPLLLIMNIIIHFCNILMIRQFDPNMLLVSNSFYYYTSRLIKFIINGGDEQYLTFNQFLLCETEEVISIFANLFYMEIIELRFCKLDYDLKRNIEKRASLETIDTLNEDSDSDESEDEILGKELVESIN